MPNQLHNKAGLGWLQEDAPCDAVFECVYVCVCARCVSRLSGIIKTKDGRRIRIFPSYFSHGKLY